MNRKGGIADLFTGMAIFLAIGFIAFISAKMGGDVIGGIQNSGVTNYSTATGAVVNDTLNAGIATSEMGDTVFLIIFAGYILSLVITALATNFHPAFFFIFVLLSMLGVVVSAPISNAYTEFSTSPEFSALIPTFPIIDMVMTNLPFVIMLISGIMMLVTYAKQRE